jgi:hypothetical protein
MKRILIALVAATSLFSTAFAKDFGPGPDVQAVRKVAKSKFPNVANVSVSHDWAMCLASDDESDLTVLLRRRSGKWSIVFSDGGALTGSDLQAKGVSKSDVANLLKSYQ